MSDDLLSALGDDARACLDALRELIHLRDSLVVRITLGPHPTPAALEIHAGHVRPAVQRLQEAMQRGNKRHGEAVERRAFQSVAVASGCGVSEADAYAAVLKLAARTLRAFDLPTARMPDSFPRIDP